jgi:hypothetical protein
MLTLVCGIYSTYTIHKCNHVLKTHVLPEQESVMAIISVTLQIHISAETALIVFKLRQMGWGYVPANTMLIYQETQHHG